MRHVRFTWLSLSLFFFTTGCSRTLSLETQPGASASPSKLRVGDAAPDFSLPALDGKSTIHVSQLTGKPIVLYFGSSTCPFFRASMPPIKRTFDHYKDSAHLVVVYTREAHPVFAVEGNDREIQEQREKIARKFATEFELAMPVVVDPAGNQVEQAYGSMPLRICVIDRNGKIAYISEPGPLGFQTGAVGPLLDKMLNTELAGDLRFAPQLAPDPDDDD